MNNKLISLFIYLLILTICTNFATAQKLKFKHITPDEGLSSSSVNSIIQDHKGFIWIATYDGLNRYDGFDFVIYKNQSGDSTSLSHNLVWCLFEDRQNNLFVGTTEGLCQFDWRTDAFVNYMDNSSSPLNGMNCTLRSIVGDSLDNLWLATDIGLIYYDRINNTITQYTHDPDDPSSLSNNSLEDIHIDRENNLWVTTRKGLNILEPNKTSFKHVKVDKTGRDITNTFFLHIVEDKNETLWFGSYEGLFKLEPIYDEELGQLTNYQHNPNNPYSLSNNRILCLFIDNQNRLWIGTESGGLNLFNREKESFKHYKSDIFDPKSLNNESIHSIYQDKSGNLWVGTFAGGINISRKNSDAILHYQNIPGVSMSLSHNSATNFLEDHTGSIWLGTDGGGLNRFDLEIERFNHYNSHNTNLKSDAIISIIEDSQNQIWLGTWAGGLNRFNKETASFTSYTTENSNIRDNNIFSVMDDKKGNLWLGSFQNGLIKFNKSQKTFKHFSVESNGLSNNMVVDIKQNSEGLLYIATPSGFNIFNPVTTENKVYTHDPDNPHSISSNSIHQIFIESDTVIWLATQKGLNLFNSNTKKFLHFDMNDGLPDDIIKGVVRDKSDQLWLATNKGVCRFDPINGTVKNFTKADGLQSNEFNPESILLTSEGFILLGGRKGFNIIYPEKITENKKIPTVLFTDFRIFNKPVKVGEKNSPLKQHISETKELTLSYKQSVLTFNFAAMDFTMPEKNQFAYMMEGFETEWNYVNNQRMANYTNLNPGQYVFRVKAANNDGIWNEEGASLKITITPPFWQTSWFRIIAGIILLALIYIIYKWRVKSIEHQKRALEVKVEERTHQLKEKAVELENSYNNLEHAKAEMDNILENVKEGFFLLDRKLELASQYSAALETVFSKKKLARMNIINFLENKIPANEVENAKNYLELMFDENVDSTQIVDLNPLVDLEFTFRDSKSITKKYLNFGFRRIKSKKSRKIELIGTVRDVTQQILLSKQLKEEEVRREKLLHLMLSILDVEPQMLSDFSESANRELSFIDKILNHDKIDDYHYLLVKVQRSIHLVKGNAKLLNIDYFANQAHEFEDQVSDLIKTKDITGKDLEPIRIRLTEIQNGMIEMETIIEKIGKVLSHKDTTKRTDAGMLLHSLENLINSFSSDLGKKIKFDYKNFKRDIIPERYHLLIKEVLIQLVRNSISHGIETPEERQKLHKPEFGVIEISTFTHDDSVGLKFRDDGRGLQLQKLKQRAIESGRWTEEEVDQWDDKRLAELIFASGITTSDKVDMVSGRGVGMDGIKHRLSEYNGRIQVNCIEQKYCEFEILLPNAA